MLEQPVVHGRCISREDACKLPASVMAGEVECGEGAEVLMISLVHESLGMRHGSQLTGARLVHPQQHTSCHSSSDSM
jgi:hypothetical protein